MSYLAAMGATEQRVEAPVAPSAPPLLDVSSTDFRARINQPIIDWFPFWLGAGAGLFIGWLIFRSGSGSKQLEQIQQAAIDKVFGGRP
jgi:hypothetical protein